MREQSVMNNTDTLFSNLCGIICSQLERDNDRPILTGALAQKLLVSSSEIIRRSKNFPDSGQALRSAILATKISAILLIDHDINILQDLAFSQKLLDDQCSFFSSLASQDALEASLQFLTILTQSLRITKRKRRFEVIQGVNLMDSITLTPNFLGKLREILTTITSNDFLDHTVLGWTFYLSALTHVDVHHSLTYVGIIRPRLDLLFIIYRLRSVRK